MRDKRSPIPWQGIPLFLILLWVGACSPSPTVQTGAPDLDVAELQKQGKALYGQSCSNCHLAGEGSDVIPPMQGSPAIVAEPVQLIQIIVKGQTGVSKWKGQILSGGMPAQGYLSDFEIAAISTYLRHQFGGIEKPVQPAEVAAARK